METIKNTSVLIVLAGIFYGIYQLATGSGTLVPNAEKHTAVNGQSENLAATPAPESQAASPLPATAPNLQDPSSSQKAFPQNRDPWPGNSPSLDPEPQFQSPPKQTPNGQFPGTGFSQGAGVGNDDSRMATNPGKFPPSLSGSGGPIATNPAPSSRSPENPFPNFNTTVGPGSEQAGFNEIPGRDDAAAKQAQFGYDSAPSSVVKGLDGQEVRMQPIRNAAAPAYLPSLTKAIKNAQGLASQGKLGEALNELSPWANMKLLPEDKARLMQWLDGIASDVIFSRQHLVGMPYTTAAGDTFNSLAKELRITPNLLASINQIKVRSFEDPIPAGTVLKVIEGPFHASANLQAKELTLYLQGKLYAVRFPFTTGKSAPINAGTHNVATFSFEGLSAQSVDGRSTIQPMAPGNPYGQYCIVFGDNVLHSPGIQSDSGCMIFSQDDMLDLLKLLTKESKILIENL